MGETEEDTNSENYERIKESKLEAKRQEALRKLQHRIGEDDQPLTVAIIGTPGSGKSSFINTIIASLTREWRSHVMIGHFGGAGESKSRHLIRLDKETYLKYAEDKSELLKYNFPTLIDMAGFQDANDEITRKLFDLIFSGRIPPKAKLPDVIETLQNYMEKKNEEGTTKKNVEDIYPCADINIKVDRIIFVVSASNRNPPFNLMRSLYSSLTSGPRAIPVFGIITKIDEPFANLGEKDYKAFVSEFKSGLGILDLNLLQCTNYCDKNLRDIKEGLRDHMPDLDTPVLQFLRHVLDPVQTVIDNEEFRLKHGFVPEVPVHGEDNTPKQPKKQNKFPKIYSLGGRLSLDNLGEYLMVAIFILLFAVLFILFRK